MWRYASGQVQGRGHIKTHTPCQDMTKTVYENDTYVIALADGAGSAALSHYGAACVVDGITDLMVRQFDELYAQEDGRQVKQTILGQLRENLAAKAQELSCSLKDLASTMLVVAVRQDQYLIAHIGDGVIGYLDGNTLKIASAPANGEHANETYFVTSADAIRTMTVFKGQLGEIAGFVLMSDGTEQSLYNKRARALNPAVIKLMQRSRILDEGAMNKQLQTTLSSVLTARTQDDCSVALLTRENSVLRPFSQLGDAQRCEVYGIRATCRCASKRLQRYDKILKVVEKPLSCRAVSAQLCLRPKYTARHLEHLCEIGLVKRSHGLYTL